MSSSLFENSSHRGTLNQAQRVNAKWLRVIAGTVVILLGAGLLTQLPVSLPWVGAMVDQSLLAWLVRVMGIAVGATLILALVKAFFSYMRDEFDLGPVPIVGFFVFGLVCALINHL